MTLNLACYFTGAGFLGGIVGYLIGYLRGVADFRVHAERQMKEVEDLLAEMKKLRAP